MASTSAAGWDAPPEDDARKNISLVVFTCTGIGSFWVGLGCFSKPQIPCVRSAPRVGVEADGYP
jgi:hypothetical protein